MKNNSHSFICQLLIAISLMLVVNSCNDKTNDPAPMETGTMTDVENHVYQTVKIGNQWWMAEDLKVTKYRNGNSILLVTFAERYRREGMSAPEAGIRAVRTRLRPVLMTSIAMIAGMIPLALGAEATAPLGRAVIGGLLFATFSTLLILPPIFGLVQGSANSGSGSLDPDDPASRFADSAPASSTN